MGRDKHQVGCSEQETGEQESVGKYSALQSSLLIYNHGDWDNEPGGHGNPF